MSALSIAGGLADCGKYAMDALLSGTDEVVKGAWAVGHIVVWSGFLLVFGVFPGLVAKGGV